MTGVGRFLGAHLAARLADHPAVTTVIGADTVPPTGELSAVRVGRSFRVPEHAVHEYLRDAFAESA